jgi:streptogramin lyase
MMKNILFLLALVLGLSGCVKSPSMPQVVAADNSCIPPIVEFAYPLFSKEKITHSSQNRILPTQPWEFVSDLPKVEDGRNGVSGSIMFARSSNKADEIWLIRASQFLVFHTDTETWSLNDIQIKGEERSPQGIFLARDNSIWGAGINGWNNDEVPILSRYNEKENYFEFVNDLQDSRIKASSVVGEPIVSDDRIWVIIDHNQLYGFNSKTLESQTHIFPSNLLSPRMVLAPDGAIYILSIRDNNLIRYDPVSETSTTISVPFAHMEAMTFDSLFMDRSGSLWFHDYGWLNREGDWYQIIRSPLFINDRTEYQFQYLWENPVILLESSNGFLWYRSANGMTWLDPEKGEWCWFTTEQSNIVEDQQHNLWMVADNKLYKLDLEP